MYNLAHAIYGNNHCGINNSSKLASKFKRHTVDMWQLKILWIYHTISHNMMLHLQNIVISTEHYVIVLLEYPGLILLLLCSYLMWILGDSVIVVSWNNLLCYSTLLNNYSAMIQYCIASNEIANYISRDDIKTMQQIFCSNKLTVLFGIFYTLIS